MNKIEKISVIIPVYNSHDCIEELIYRLNKVLYKTNNQFEIILVNDYSKDDSWRKITKIIS